MLSPNGIYQGDARELLPQVRPESVALSFWSPPYFVGKSYEADLGFADWSDLMRETIERHFPIIVPGGFLAVNIADILAFEDPEMPRIQADNVSAKKVRITREGFYPYDRRIWVKDPAWENSRWRSLSYRFVDEREHLGFDVKSESVALAESRVQEALAATEMVEQVVV